MSVVRPRPAEKGIKALVVDDDPSARIVVTKILEREGFLVTQACDGCEAIQALDRCDFGLICLDLVMPRVDGTEVVEHMRETKPHLLDRTFLVTGYPQQLYGNPGVRAVLSKPFTRDKLTTMVQEAEVTR